MNVLLIGFGSIGKRHFEVLNTFHKVTSVDVVTRQDVKSITSFKALRDVRNLNSYDYFIIASETSKHYEQLKYICSKVTEKKILVEKPLYDKKYESLECNNQIFTAYNLRFHPVLKKLKHLLKNEKVYYVNAICGQYLPTWRPEQDYRKSYSADINQGGGVLRDLSHELDYINWLFGNIEKIDSINTKVSDLEINSDDIFTAIAITKDRAIINLTVDYISKIPMRRLIIHTSNHSIEADVIKNSIVVYDKDTHAGTIELEEIDRNYTYAQMHNSIMDNRFDTVCSFHEGNEVVDTIENIEFKEL